MIRRIFVYYFSNLDINAIVIFMNLSVVQLIKLGQKYSKLWPEKAELAQYFADYRVVQSARFVCRYFPALALFTVMMQLYFASGFFARLRQHK